MSTDIMEVLRFEWMREDRKYLAYLQKTLPEFEELYLKYFSKPLYRQVNRLMINDIVGEINRIKEQLFPVKTGVTYKINSITEVVSGKLKSNQHSANSGCLAYSMA